jgi:hypothetical protein
LVAGLALASLTGCKEKGRTEIIIGIATDLMAPAPLNNVRLQAFHLPDKTVLGDQPLPISGSIDNDYELPGTYAVYSENGTADRFQVVLTAFDTAGKVVVERKAVLSLVPEKTLFVRLGMVSACAGKSDCPDTDTCIEGRCAPQEIDSSRLPPYEAGLEKQVTCAGTVSFVDTSTKLPLMVTGTKCPNKGVCQEGVCLGAVTGSFTATQGPPVAVRSAAYEIGSTLVTLTSGSVLAAGGIGPNATPVLTSAETYDPVTRKFGPVGSLGTARVYFGETKLMDGRVLLAGGINEGQAALATAEIYNPATKTFAPTKVPMTVARVFPALVTLSDGRVLVVGGMNDIQSYSLGSVAYFGALASSEIYDPATDTFTATAGSLSEGRAFPHVTALAGGAALALCGSSQGAPRASLERFNGATGVWTAAVPARLPGTASQCDSNVAELKDGRLLVTMGPASDVWLLDPVLGTFTAVGSHPVTPPAMLVAVLSDGRALYAGAGAGKQAYLYDPVTATFAFTVGEMSVMRTSLMGAALANGDALIVGAGTSSAEIFHPGAALAGGAVPAAAP